MVRQCAPRLLGIAASDAVCNAAMLEQAHKLRCNTATAACLPYLLRSSELRARSAIIVYCRVLAAC